MPRKKFFIPPCPAGNAPPQFGADKPWLAPMAGYSDLPFRMLCREFGAATCVTEMVSAKGLVFKSPGTGELLQSIPADQPLVIQLFGGDPVTMGEAVRILRANGYAWFDCNLGCPARKVLKQNSGARLLVDKDLVLAIAQSMITAAREGDSPGGVGFKLRLGMDEAHPAHPDLALYLRDSGASWISLHPRYAKQGYSGCASWEHIANVARQLDIPVLASGDLLSAETGLECLRQTGARGVMYARGALRNPFIFARHLALAKGMQAPALSHDSLCSMIMRHIELTRQLCPHSAIHKMRSIVPRYVRELPGAHKLRLALAECEEWNNITDILAKFMGANPGGGE